MICHLFQTSVSFTTTLYNQMAPETCSMDADACRFAKALILRQLKPLVLDAAPLPSARDERTRHSMGRNGR